jgi:SAM-dependent methyltransferase
MIAAAVLVIMLLTLLHYPYDTDPATNADGHDISAREYYRDAYEQSAVVSTKRRFVEDEEYVEKARAHANTAGIPRIIESFVRTYGVAHGRVLDVGAGSGLLQDVVDRYTGLDVSSRAHRFFHKPFIEGSATHLPFRDGTFDMVWSIWTLEHVSNPEQALTEIRRVAKEDGYILLRPAWNCDPWAADGYEVRPYSDFSLTGKLVKASIPIRRSRAYLFLYSRQIRLLRTVLTKLSGRPSRLRLKPNYSRYWVTDSDAVVSLDFFEMFLWFSSRGDECVNSPSLAALLFGRLGRRPEELVIRIRKTRTARPPVCRGC